MKRDRHVSATFLFGLATFISILLLAAHVAGMRMTAGGAEQFDQEMVDTWPLLLFRLVALALGFWGVMLWTERRRRRSDATGPARRER